MSYAIPLTADKRIGLIRIKTARAYQYVQDLEREIREFLDKNPYKVATKPHPQFPNVFTQHYVASVRNMDAIIPLLAGEVIHHMRSALDYLAWDLVSIGSAAQGITLTDRECRQIGFPITNTESATEYEASRKRKVKGMTQAAIKAIDATKPYKTGNRLLWKLGELNNVDKHRLLIAVGAQLGNFTAPRFIRRGLARKILEDKGADIPPDVDLSELLSFTIIPDERKCPLEVGDVLLFGMDHILDKDEEVNFTFEIVLYEQGVAECEPLLPLLVQMLNYVNNLILSFKPLLA